MFLCVLYEHFINLLHKKLLNTIQLSPEIVSYFSLVSDNETLIAQLNFTSSMMAAVYYNDEGKWVGDGCEVSLFYAHHMNSVKTLKYRKVNQDPDFSRSWVIHH